MSPDYPSDGEALTAVQGGSLALLLATLILPGLAVGAVAGLRGWLLVSCSPLLTYAVIAIAAPIVPQVLGGWSWVGLLLSTALLSFGVLAIRLMVRMKSGTMHVRQEFAGPTWQLHHHVAVTAAVLATAAFGCYVIGRSTEGFTAVHQFWDAIFHANAVRFIADTGQSDPTALRVIGPADGIFYYPNAFHVQVATTLGLTDASVVDLLNLRSGLTAGLLSISMVALVRQTVGRPALAVAVAVMCGAFSAFPYDLAFFGPLWPFGTGVALLPAFLALFLATLRAPHLMMVVVAALGMIGLTAIHPSIALAAMLATVLLVMQRWFVLRKIPPRDIAVLAGAGALAGIYLLPVILITRQIVVATPMDWPAVTTPWDALLQLVTLRHEAESMQAWLIAAMIAGALGVWLIRSLVWWLALGAIFATLFVLSAASEGDLVALLTNPWWNDRWRFAALVTPAFVLLAANGLVVARDLVLRLPYVFPGRPGIVVRGVLLLIVIALFAFFSHGLYTSRNVERVANAYRDRPTLGVQERDALAELVPLVPPGSLVMNDSNDGSAWMWALHDLQPVYGHALPDVLHATETDLSSLDQDRVLLYDHFDELDTDPAVRAAIQRLRIGYVIVGEGFASPSSERAPGLDALDGVRGLELVYTNPEAKIYRVALDRVPLPPPQRGQLVAAQPATLGS